MDLRCDSTNDAHTGASVISPVVVRHRHAHAPCDNGLPATGTAIGWTPHTPLPAWPGAQDKR
jgi:hypothetical protein